ncbi:major facilitator superfamily, partial [Fimicolochytrium jonesii]|uniref:major facilitator superfamily n=1 Tax=Fimicolochytrium jonesii TaxID=1396493 RepID=UPI0022FE66F9
AQLLDAINLSGASVALPLIRKDLGFSVSSLQWVISAYALTFGGFLLLTGRLGDVYGHRKFFVAGLAWFTVFAVVSGLSTSSTMLIIARGLQGVGAAATIPNAIALILRVYPIGRSRNRAMAMFSSTGAVGFVVGLIIGGSVTQSSLGWRWMFHLSAIISTILFVIGVVVIPADLPGEEKKKAPTNASDESLVSPVTAPEKKQSIDWFGGLLSTGSMLLLVFVLTDANSRGWGSPLIISLLIVSIVVFAAFIFVEFKVDSPLMPPAIWKLPNFAPAFAIAACVMAYFQAYLYFMTLIFQQIMGYDALQTAVRYLPVGIMASVVGLFFGEKILHYLNPKMALVGGLALGTVGNIILGFYRHEDQYWSILFPAFIVGILGMSSTYVSASVVAISVAPMHLVGIVGGLLNTGFQIGGGLGLAITTVVATSVIPDTETADNETLMNGYHAAIWTASGIVLLALFGAIMFVKNIPP